MDFHKATLCFKSYKHYFEEYEFSLALLQYESFFWQDFCDNYLELIKDQLMNPEKLLETEVAATRGHSLLLECESFNYMLHLFPMLPKRSIDCFIETM